MAKMKKEYEKVFIEVVDFKCPDVLCASGVDPDDTDWGGGQGKPW